jgi:hypothetical protein
MGLFLYMFLLYISFYIFNVIIFGDTEAWDFKILKKLKVKGSLVPMCQIDFPGNNNTSFFLIRLTCGAMSTLSNELMFVTDKWVPPSVPGNSCLIDDLLKLQKKTQLDR